ncbi:MAG: gluconate 2-dehydrogenase subunit 3 family protein [Verrucomicrobiales bacterium]|jgi:hypothetical protein|nr:gluconate 2-dehydrogenase subunit 3 family protein [Verrucomicrobiales bacterium]MBP9224031.1 gluconate 2-dehydrogenase subunit 3 family protein [Verrucomicrobiales bacterium]HQZ27238.1 gluconate 2-dehydrogenase subunit 3 family protein [Verrucomicrobiales bacterium]
MTASPDPAPRLPRRKVLQMFAAATAATGASGLDPFLPSSYGAPPAPLAATGYGTDPLLAKVYARGEVWPLTLTDAENAAIKALCDVILPADDFGPAASSVGVPEFLDEWVSAPYPSQQQDRPVIITGLAWIDEESKKRFGKAFHELEEVRQFAICDDICDPEKAAPEFKKAAKFFEKLKTLASGGYYSTQEGWKAIGFVGNLATATFDGPPPEVLRQLDVEQTVA